MAKSLLEQYDAYKKKRQAEEELAKQQAIKPTYDIPSTGTFAERYEAYKQQRIAEERSASMRNNVNSPHQNPLQLANRRSDAIAQGTKRRQEDAARAAKEEETTRAKQADKQLHLDTVDRLTKQYMPSNGFEDTVFKLLNIERPEEKKPDPIPQVDINKKYGPESELPKRGAAIASAGASDAPFGFGKIVDLSGDGGSMSVRNSAMDEADRERMEQAERDRKDQTARDDLDARIAKEQRAQLEREHTAALAKLYSGTLSSEEYAAQEALAGELADRLNGVDGAADAVNKPQNKLVNGWDYDANKAQDARRVELEDELARMYQMTSSGRGGSIDGGKTALETADRERLEFAQRDMQGNEEREALIERTKPTYKDLSIEELQTKRGEAIADIAQYDKVLEWAPSPQNVEAYRNYIAAKVQKQAAEQAIQQIDQGIQGQQDIQLVEKLKSDYSKASDPFEKAEIDAALKAAEFKRDWNAMSPIDRAGTWVYDRIKRGFYQFNQAYYGFTTDWIFDVLGIKRLDVSTFNQKQLEEVQTAIEKQAKNTSWITDKAGDIVTMAVQNIPSIIFGLAGGAGSAASSTAAMVNAGSSLLGKVSKAAFDMLKNPHFLNSLFGSIGRGYIEEHDVKGNDILTSLVNSTMKAIPESMIEVGGGIETAPMKPRGLVTAVETAAEEGLEEIFQKGSSGIYDYSQSGKGENTTLKDVISWDNPESIIPIKQTIEEGLMGAAGGGVMGGAQQLVLKGVDAAANANQERNMNTTMGRIVESNAGPKAVVDFVIANLDAQSKSAELAAKMGAKPSIGDIGRLTRTAREELTEKIYAAANFDEQMALIGQAKQLDELALGVVQQEQAAMESAMEAAQRERIEQQDREVRDNKAYEIIKSELQGAGEIGKAMQQEVDAAPERTGDILLAYELGKLGLPKDKLMSIKGMMNIGEETAGRVYGMGSQAWEAALPGKTKKAEQTRAQMPRAGEGNVSFDESVNKDVWNAAQRKQVEHDSAVAQILGLDVTFYQSSPNEEGQFTEVEGIYRAADGSIRIDINAGRRTQVLDDQGKIDWEQSKGDALMTLTMGHELTHHLIETNPELGREYIGVVLSELLDKNQDIQALIDGKVKRAAANKRTIGIEEAINEVVADGSEGILADETVMQKVARQHPGLFTRIKDWILSYTKKLREAISGMELLRTESKALGDAGKGLIRYSERITELYSRMMSADLAARSAEKPAVSVKVREASPAVEAKKEAPKTVKDSASDKAPDWAGNGITAGSADTVFTAENEEISFRYAVLPYDRLVTSMNTDMSINDAYPKELQPRDTERSASEDLVLDISRNLNFKRASSSGEVNSGAPLVGPDMVVEVGNHRAVGIMKAIESGGKAAQRYTQALKDGAAEFGIDPADISDKSVLVRVRESGVDSRRRLAMDGNAPVTNAYSDTESAATDAAKIKPGLLDMAEMGSGDIDTAANAKFVARFVSEVVPKTERGRMVDSEGKLSRTGEARIRNALFQLAYGDGYLTEQLAEATDTESRNMIKAMTAIAPRLASMNADMKRGLLHDLDVGGEIAESYRTVLRQKLAGVSVEAYLAQTTMLEDVPAAQRLLLEMFVENKRSAVKMTEALDSILDALEAQGDPRQAGMFGVDMKPTAEGVISEGLRNFRQGLEERVAASERYSLRELPDGTKYVFVDSDQDVFDSVTEDRYAHVARRYIIDHFSGKVIGDTNRAFVQLDSANEYAYPAKKNMDQTAREAKLRAAPELPNIVEAGTFVGHSEDDGRHPEAVRGWDYYQVIYQVADRIFEGKTSIKKIERGDVFYNVTKIRDITTSFAAKYGKNPKYRDQSNASVQSIPAADDNSQELFSMREPIEETRELIAVHNLTEKKLRDVISLGGFPMPSIAVTKAALGHDAFGDISVVFRKEAIDPKRHKDNRIYSQDAWTPTFPEVGYKLNEKALKKVEDYLVGLVDDAQFKSRIKSDFYAENIQDMMKRSGMRSLAWDERYLTAYAKAQGIALPEGNFGFGSIQEAWLEKNGKTREDVGVWLDGLIEPTIEKKGVWKGADPYTPSGGRKGWSGLYAEYTLENIVKIMKNEPETGASGFSNALTSAGDRFSSIQALKKESGRVQADEDHDSRKGALEDRLYSVASEIAGDDKGFQRIDGILDELKTAAQKKYRTVPQVMNYLNAVSNQYKLNYNVTGKAVAEYVQIMEEARNLPVRYFEAKPRRAMPLYEVAAVIAPEGIDEDLTKPFSRMGIEVLTYKEGNNADRTEKLNSLERWMFSERQRDMLSKREILAGAFDQVATSDGEKRQLSEYKKLIRSLNRFEREAAELRAQNTEERRKRGEADKSLIASRAAQISEIEERIDAADRRLLRMQNAVPLRNILKRESDRIYTRAQEQKKEKLDQWRQAREDNAEHTSLVNSITKTVTAMQKWINEPNTKTGNYVPDMLVMPLGKMLEGIDIQSKRALNGGDRTSADKAFLSGMDAMYSTLEGYSKDLNKEDGSVSFYLDLPSNMLEAMNGLIASMKELVETGGPQGYIINQMSNEQLSVLEETLTTLRTAIRTINATHVNSVFEHVNEAAEDNISEVEGLRKKGRNSQVMKFFNWLNATPVYAFERMGKAARSFFEAMQDGADKLAYHVKNEVDFAKSAFSGKEVRDWNDEVKTFNVKGKQLQIPVSTMMSIYLLSKRNQAMGHIMGAGIRIANFKQGAQTIQQKGVVVNDTALLEQIEAALTDRQKDVANALQRRMSTVGARLGNEVSMKRFGTRMFTEPNYFPIEVDNTELSNPKDDDSGRKSTMFSLLNMSATKQLTKKANNRLVARDVFTVYADHMSDMARYNAMALPILDMIKWYNYRNVQKDETGRVTDIRSTKGAFLDSFGDGANTYIRRMLENANGADKQSSADRIGNKFLGKYNRAVIAANLRVALLQPTAYMKAAMVINPLSMGSGLIKSVAQLKANIAEMEANSGIAQWKQMGFYDLNVSNTVQELIKRDEGVIEKFGEKAMWLPGFMDRITWASLWQATKDDVSRKMPELKGDAFMDQVKKSFRDMVYRTQVVDSVLTRSEFMRQSSFAAKSFSSFMSEGTQAYNLAMNAVHKLTDEVNRGTNIAGAWKKHGGTVARTVATYTTVAAVTALVEAISDAYRDDDELKPFLEKVQEAYAGNLFNNLLPINIPIVSDMIEAGKRLAKELGADTYGFSETSALTAGFDYLTDFVKQFKSWQEKQGDGGYQVYGWTYKILQSLSTFTGVPMANLSREIVTAWNAFAKVADPGKVIKTYERKGDAYDALYKAIEMQDEERRQKALKLLEERGDTQKEIDKGYWDARSRATGEKKYETWVSGIRTGDNLRKIMEDYMAHGVTAQTLGGEITGSFREEYVGLVNSGRISEAAALKGRLLNAYILLGYKRDDKNKDIDKWVVEEAKKNKK